MKHSRESSTRSELSNASLRCVMRFGKGSANSFSLIVDMNATLGNDYFENAKKLSVRTLGRDGMAKGKGKMGVGTKYVGPNHSSFGFAASGQGAASLSVSGQLLHSEGKRSWAHVMAASQSKGKTPILFHAPEFSSDGVVVVNLPISNRPILLQRWCPDMVLNKESPKFIPLWIHGVRRIGFVRFLIKVDVARKLPKMVRVRLPIEESNETLCVDVRVK
ncbi:hypothetical protein Patl1_18912 [Pistacia atlantica]|uniref:Uncharacterized protein n=1 Tax=Pistacia atlantica TaxID=434234 RepID=A0ACC1C2S4_9ROSI|nr:hypothetical protein Patl1_18912 [Pistacia atlantica]